jgi:hypothetical protein
MLSKIEVEHQASGPISKSGDIFNGTEFCTAQSNVSLARATLVD